MKKLPYDKTVVMELKVQLADLFSRNVVLKSSTSAPVPNTDQFHSGDATVTQASPISIPEIKNCLIVSSFEDFEIVLGLPGSETVLTCRGLYLHNGQSSNVLIRPAGVALQARIQFIWS